MVCLNALARHFQAQVIQARERAQVGAIKGSIGHVEVFQMDGVGISIIGRPRLLPGHDTPNTAHNTYTLNYEEPNSLTNDISLMRTDAIVAGIACGFVCRQIELRYAAWSAGVVVPALAGLPAL